MTVETLTYAIDDEDRLIRVDDGFYRFAAENGWDGAGDSLGRSLWDFVAGQRGEEAAAAAAAPGAGRGADGRASLRCDGPDAAREMDIRIAADRSGRVVLFSARLRSNGFATRRSRCSTRTRPAPKATS